jgi:hypothetical protein
MKKIVIVIMILFVFLMSSCALFKSKEATESGIVTISVVDINNQIVKEKEISFNEGDTLVSLVQNNFDNVVMDGTMIMSIETLTTPSNWSTYICIKVNGEDSMVGIMDIVLKDGDHISFVDTVNMYA